MTASSGIIWLASFPKSGNTWFRILLANLAAGDDADINNLDEYCGIAGSRHDFETATMLDSGLLSHDDIDTLRPPVYERVAQDFPEQRWMKVHDAYAALPSGEPLLGHTARAAVYLVRDPRDVAISLSYHNDIAIDEAIALMNRTDTALCAGKTGLEVQLRQRLRDWSGHVTSWLDQGDVPVHVIRYEDLRADAAACFGRALVFVGHNAAAIEIERAVRRADFSGLQRRESKAGFSERRPGASPFFRAGKVGAWREALNAEQRMRIEAAHATVMGRLGYARA